MSSRQEEKERRRKEREEAERKASAQSARTKRLQIIGGAVIGIAAIVVAVVLITSGGGGSGDGGGNGSVSTTASTAVKLPARKITNLEDGGQDGRLHAEEPADRGPRATRRHTVTYKTNPPTSGNHNPEPSQDGVYDPGNTPSPEHYVHSLEHGRIELQYKKGSPQRTIDTLTAIFNEPVNGSPGYHALVFENNTGMPAAVAATAWGR